MSKVLENDIQSLIKEKKYFEPFENCSVLVTGSTGLIGLILVKSLVSYSMTNNKNIKVYAACRSKSKFDRIFGNYKSENLIPVYSDILSLNISDLQLDYIIHGASITDSKTFVKKPVETIEIAIDGTRNLLKQCINNKIKGFVYLSSLEVYGTFNEFNEIKTVVENDAGFIDTMSVRSSYSESKRMVENICASYASEYKIPIKVVRLCQTFGAGVEYNDSRVFAQFARSVIEGKDIILKTKGETVRNYCYTTDAVSGILMVLSKGNVGEAYNVANMDTTISIADMAELVCSLYSESGSKVIFDIAEDVEKLGYNPMVKLQLDSTKTVALGWHSKVDLKNMFKRLVSGMKEENK